MIFGLLQLLAATPQMRFREDVSGISGDASGSAVVVFGSSLLAKKDMCFLGHAIHGLSIIIWLCIFVGFHSHHHYIFDYFWLWNCWVSLPKKRTMVLECLPTFTNVNILTLAYHFCRVVWPSKVSQFGNFCLLADTSTTDFNPPVFLSNSFAILGCLTPNDSPSLVQSPWRIPSGNPQKSVRGIFQPRLSTRVYIHYSPKKLYHWFLLLILSYIDIGIHCLSLSLYI